MAKIIPFRTRPPADRPDRCETCRYWESRADGEYPEHKDTGDCHRFPPRMTTDIEFSESIDETTGAFTGFFPETQCWEWCGEWAPQEKGE